VRAATHIVVALHVAERRLRLLKRDLIDLVAHRADEQVAAAVAAERVRGGGLATLRVELVELLVVHLDGHPLELGRHPPVR
jgi:hypothetical protein